MGQAHFYRYYFDGRALLAVNVEENDYAVGFAFRHPIDRPSKAIGRKVAEGRLNTGKNSFVRLSKEAVKAHNGIFNALASEVDLRYQKEFAEAHEEQVECFTDDEGNPVEPDEYEMSVIGKYAHQDAAGVVAEGLGLPHWFLYRLVQHAKSL